MKFRRDFSFDIRHLFERDVYQCARSGIGVYYIQKFSTVYAHLQPERTVLSYHPGVNSCSSGSIEVWMP